MGVQDHLIQFASTGPMIFTFQPCKRFFEILFFGEHKATSAASLIGKMFFGVYFEGLEPLEDAPVPISIGTDASEVSHVLPLITLSAAIMCKGTPLHHWAAAKQAGMSIGHKGMLYAARCMAEGTKLLIETPDGIKRAWEYHLKEK